jgi:hypothetical protein
VTNDLYFIFINAFILLIWFKTEALYEYGSKIPIINKTLKLNKYIEFKRKYSDVKYPVFLSIEYNNFFTRLISCPVCLNTWLNMLSYPFISIYSIIFLNFFGSLILYYISVILMKYHDREES